MIRAVIDTNVLVSAMISLSGLTPFLNVAVYFTGVAVRIENDVSNLTSPLTMTRIE
jgi:predicted nucleic acid-binding protein